MNEKIESTADKILSATVNLMSMKGYKAVSVKEIAAQVSMSEMTIFRTFGSKKAILDAIVERYQYLAPMEKLFQQNVTYDLEKDLLIFSQLYHEVMEKNKQVYLISVMERNTMPEMHLDLHKHAEKLKVLLIDYLTIMQQKGLVTSGNAETQALVLLRFNYGKFVSDTLTNDTISSLAMDDYLKESISVIVKGLKS